MSRPKLYTESRVTTAVRLPASLRRQLDDEAAARDVSRNYLVVRALSDYLARLGVKERDVGEAHVDDPHPDAIASESAGES